MRERVLAAQEIQWERYKGREFQYNAQIPAREVERYCGLGRAERNLLREFSEEMELSARACHKIMKVARTIADLESRESVEVNDGREEMERISGTGIFFLPD